jgi:Mg2+/Co2+ transporter CorB
MHSLADAPAIFALAGIVALLLVAALLAGAETALTTASRTRLHAMAERGEKGAGAALRVSEDKERLVGALRFGTTLANVLAVALATGFLAGRFGAEGVALAALMALVIVAAEVLARTLAVARAEAVSTRAAAAVAIVVSALAPVAAAARASARRALGLFGVEVDPGIDVLSAQQEIAGTITLHHSEGAVETADRDLLLGALDLGQREVEEVMMHRRDIEMIDAEAAPSEILEQAINSPHTRIPIFRGEPENIVGVIHAKDLSRAVHRFVREQRAGEGALEGFDIMDVAMPPYFVPESTPLDEQMREFLRRRTHFALVVDEYGALQGLVTLEDIIEEIVGDIADEHDVETPRRHRAAAGRLGGRGRQRDDPRPQPRLRLEPPRRGGEHHRRPRHPRGAGDPERGPGLQLPRLPLRGARPRGQPSVTAQDAPAGVTGRYSLGALLPRTR